MLLVNRGRLSSCFEYHARRLTGEEDDDVLVDATSVVAAARVTEDENEVDKIFLLELNLDKRVILFLDMDLRPPVATAEDE